MTLGFKVCDTIISEHFFTNTSFSIYGKIYIKTEQYGNLIQTILLLLNCFLCLKLSYLEMTNKQPLYVCMYFNVNMDSV